MPGALFYTIIIGFTSGIVFRSFFETRLPDVVFLLFLSFTLALVWRVKSQTYRSPLFLISLFLLTCGIGIIRLDLREGQTSSLALEVGRTSTWEGVVAREPDKRETSTHLYVREEETKELVLVIADPHERVAYGDHVTVRGTMKVPESFETDTGRTFDYAGYLKAKGVREMISFGKITVLGSGEGNPILARLYLVKQALIESLERSIPQPAAGLGEGILLGVKRALGKDLTETFRVAGIIHIVVLSGYNIMIVADSVMRALGYFFYPRTRLIVGISCIVLFALLVGLSATVVRASIMVSLVLVARHIGRQYAGLRALCLTGLVMLLMNPYLLAFDPGFQLSFLATLGLILFSPVLEKKLTTIPTRWGIRGYLSTTLGTQLYVLPLLIFSMGTVSLVSVAVNMLVLPLVPVAMSMTFVAGIAGLVSQGVGVVLGFGAHIILTYIIHIAAFAASLPFAEVKVPPLHVSVVFFMFMGIGVLTYLWNRPRSHEIQNDYADWVIETEYETAPGTASVPGAVSDPLPFK